MATRKTPWLDQEARMQVDVRADERTLKRCTRIKRVVDAGVAPP